VLFSKKKQQRSFSLPVKYLPLYKTVSYPMSFVIQSQLVNRQAVHRVSCLQI
jgi:hypothetical protein